jgi:uncharacterized protein YaaW (UPF0174 family)
MTEEQFEAMKHAGDAAAVIVTVGTLASILPPVAAFLTIIWTAIRIWETKTVQGFLSYMRGE